MCSQPEFVSEWVALEGRWEFRETSAKYLGPLSPASTDGEGNPVSYGLALGKARIRSGSIQTTVCLPEKPYRSEGRVIFGYHPMTRAYYASGIGGYKMAYVVDEYVPGRAWQPIGGAGSSQNFPPGAEFDIETRLHGQHVELFVKGIKVVEINLPQPLHGDQIGLLAWGPSPVEFKDTKIVTETPKAFVAMQFGDYYDELYQQVIRPITDGLHLVAYRADEIHKPGFILRDIVDGIAKAEVVIAEITPTEGRGYNPNVFYELGYAHAMNKPTVLLVQNKAILPFDISGYRCIMYDNTIQGKADIEMKLQKHLLSILGPDWQYDQVTCDLEAL